jgi:hypothetical protein
LNTWEESAELSDGDGPDDGSEDEGPDDDHSVRAKDGVALKIYKNCEACFSTWVSVKLCTRVEILNQTSASHQILILSLSGFVIVRF